MYLKLNTYNFLKIVLDFLINFFYKIQFLVNQWWPWIAIWDDIFYIQLFLIYTYTYIYIYKNIYYILLYSFLNFFLIGIYLSIFQIDLFTAFLWLIECSVLFVFLLLLFYLNIKGCYTFLYKQLFVYVFPFIIFIIYVLLNFYINSDSFNIFGINFYSLIDNYYEAFINNINNDLFGFSICYYLLNGVEFILVGFLLLIGSVICVNLYNLNKNIRSQPYNNYLTLFNFFTDFINFSFFRKQNLIKQGNIKASLKIFTKK